MSERSDIFTKRGITPPWEPGGRVARAQGFAWYDGAGWRERRACVKQYERVYGRDAHPDPAAIRRRLWGRYLERAEKKYGRHAVTLYLEEHHSPDVERFLSAHNAALPGRIARSWAYWLERVLAVDGWYMPRHVAMPDEPGFGGHLVGQLRPDVPVVLSPTGWEWHQHYWDLPARSRRMHENSLCSWSAEPHGKPLATRTREGRKEYLIPTGHLHPDTGELVVPFRKEDGRRYLRHRHWEEAKYVYTPGDTAKGLATHPHTLANGFGDGLFVIVLEGTLKMCAVTEAGYPCIDAGSVTLWHRGTPEVELDDEGNLTGAEFSHHIIPGDGGRTMRLPARLELEVFAKKHLAGRPVAVVVDSDWSSNELVREQAEMVAQLIRPYAGNVFACAPPDEGRSYAWRHPLRGVLQREKLGVDDWLGLARKKGRSTGEAFLELGRWEHDEPPTLTVDDPRLLVPYDDGRTPYITGRRSAVAYALKVGSRAGPDGVAPYELNAITAELNAEGFKIARSNVQKAHERCVATGIVTPLTEATRHGDGRRVRTEAALVRVAPEAMPSGRWRSLRDWLK